MAAYTSQGARIEHGAVLPKIEALPCYTTEAYIAPSIIYNQLSIMRRRLMPKKNVGGRPRIDPKEKRIASTFAVSPTVLRQIEKVADERGVSRPEIINEWLAKASTIVEAPELG